MTAGWSLAGLINLTAGHFSTLEAVFINKTMALNYMKSGTNTSIPITPEKMLSLTSRYSTMKVTGTTTGKKAAL